MSKKKDENETAFDALQEIIRRDKKRNGLPIDPIPKEEKIPYRKEAGEKGGIIGGLARAKKLSKKRRSEIARKAARARWRKKQ